MGNDQPCCAADALRCVRQLKINGMMTGITMIDESIEEVMSQDPGSDQEIRAALVKKIRMYNYVPKSAEEEYARVLMEEYKKAIVNK